jgi:hypothetical protein
MSVVRKTDVDLSGPWLLDQSALRELDKIIDEAIERFSRHQKKEMARVLRGEYAKEKGSNYWPTLSEEKQRETLRRVRQRVKASREFGRRSRKITLRLKSGKRVPDVERFEEAIVHPDFAKELPVGFKLAVKHGATDIEMQLSTLWSEKLQINVAPPEGTACYDAFVELHQWAERNQPHPMMTRWQKYAGLHWPVVILILSLLLILTGNTAGKPTQMLKTEAKQMLADGFTEDEEHKALELLLAINAGYARPGTQGRVEVWMLAVLGLALGGGIVFSNAPSARLGIGKGVESIKWQRWWWTAISKGVVGTVMVGIVVAYFQEWLLALLGFHG